MNGSLSMRRLLLIILIGALGWKFLAPMIADPIEKRKENLLAIERDTDELRNRLSISNRYLEKIRAFGMTSLPPEAATASVRYQEWLRSICESVGIVQPRVTVSESTSVEGLGSKLQASIRTTSNINAIGDLIDILSNVKMTHRMVNTKLRNWDSQLQRMEVEIDLEAIAMLDNSNYDATIFNQEISTSGLGDFMERRQSFARYVPPTPKAPDITVSLEQPQADLGPPPDPAKLDTLAAIRLVGIIEKDGVLKALFFDSDQQKEIMLSQSQSLSLEPLTGIVKLIDQDKLVMIIGNREVVVILGQTIRQSVSSATKPVLFQ